MPAVTRTFVIDALERIAYTFLGTFLGTLGVTWASSGLDAGHLTDWSAWQKLLGAAVVAAAAAAFTTAKTLIAGLFTGTGSTSKQVAETAVVPVGEHAAVVVAGAGLNDATTSGVPPATAVAAVHDEAADSTVWSGNNAAVLIQSMANTTLSPIVVEPTSD